MPGRTVKQEQEEISRNHVQTFICLSVLEIDVTNTQVDFAVDMNYPKSQLNVVGPQRDTIQKQIQQDFVKADIYFKSLNVQTITQKKKYTVCMYSAVPKKPGQRFCELKKCSRNLWPRWFMQ